MVAPLAGDLAVGGHASTVIISGPGGDSGDDRVLVSSPAGRSESRVSSAGDLSVVVEGRIALSVAQNGSALSGTWASTFNNGYNNGGALSGSINVSGSMTVTLTPSVPTSCPFNATANISGNQASGTCAAFNCISAVTGTFTLTKQ